MKFSRYLSAYVMSCCLAVVISTSTKSTNSSTETPEATTSTENSTHVSSTETAAQTRNSDTTIETTQPSTMPTTQSPVVCKNGTCSGNNTCMNNINETCTLTGSESCYQIVYTNGTDTYEVGCNSNCTYQHDETMTKRCCTGQLCNKELLPDPSTTDSSTTTPGDGNDSARSSLSVASVALSLLVCSIFK